MILHSFFDWDLTNMFYSSCNFFLCNVIASYSLPLMEKKCLAIENKIHNQTKHIELPSFWLSQGAPISLLVLLWI